jgi:ubiquinone/menaquinone biosynthesis C-methylase UbiE
MKERKIMGELFNLTNANVKLYDGDPRNMDPTFGEAYFDKTRDTGYGGYYYDGRWEAVAETVIKRYNLDSKKKLLDVGCGKGFLLHDLQKKCQGITLRGLEVSQYAIDKAHGNTREVIDFGSAATLSYADNEFDCVTSINTFHFLTPEECQVALNEMVRVMKDPSKGFIQVDAFTDEVEKERLFAWAPIVKSFLSVDEWLAMFKHVGYEGDYYWTFVRPQTPEKFYK